MVDPRVRGFVVKARPDKDLYLIWNNSVDNVVYIGSKDDLINELGIEEHRIDAADERGSSSGLKDGWWGEDLRVMELIEGFRELYPEEGIGAWYLKRDFVWQYAVALFSEDHTVVRECLEYRLHE